MTLSDKLTPAPSRALFALRTELDEPEAAKVREAHRAAKRAAVEAQLLVQYEADVIAQKVIRRNAKLHAANLRRNLVKRGILRVSV